MLEVNQNVADRAFKIGGVRIYKNRLRILKIGRLINSIRPVYHRYSHDKLQHTLFSCSWVFLNVNDIFLPLVSGI